MVLVFRICGVREFGLIRSPYLVNPCKPVCGLQTLAVLGLTVFDPASRLGARSLEGGRGLPGLMMLV